MNESGASEALLMRLPVGMRNLVARLLTVRCVADKMPSVIQNTVTNGRIASLVFVTAYLVFTSLWLPFWILSFLTGETTIYVMAVVSIFLGGRSIIRLIAFPGANTSMGTDIQTEFSRYSVRMITSAANAIKEVPLALLNPRSTRKSLPDLWTSALVYRNRVLGMFADVLLCLYGQPASGIHDSDSDLTRYGNNRLSGDIGDLSDLTTKARMDGQALLDKLLSTLRELDAFEGVVGNVLRGQAPVSSVGESSKAAASKKLVEALTGLCDFVDSLSPPPSQRQGNDRNGDLTSALADQNEKQSSPIEMVKGVASSIMPMLDPSPHDHIFGFDVQRGCMLSRYRKANQFWVHRPSGGMIDVIHFPSHVQSHGVRNTRAVLYCNPNAGLIELAAGMSLLGGNVKAGSDSSDSWVDFYAHEGYDIFVFNYAGFGRSHGNGLCTGPRSHKQGTLARLVRIVQSCFFAFAPTPDTLRSDGVTVANYLLNEIGVERLVVHGESIGGLAASRTTRTLSNNPLASKSLRLLVCDRTFCNLEAVAQRLVGGWSGYAIRGLAPFWDTDVAADFIGTTCVKLVCNDAADTIISDAASLKSGIAIWKELKCPKTTGVGWLNEDPIQYRMAEWENVCVNDSKYVPFGHQLVRHPTWPDAATISTDAAFHFSACCKRIAKVASKSSEPRGIGEEGNLIVRAWLVLSCCDGLTGGTIGVATKRGFDATAAWLCSCLVFGGQHLVERAEQRLGSRSIESVDLEDFDGRPHGYEASESPVQVFPKPIPEVIEQIRVLMEQEDSVISSVDHELQYACGVLQYIVDRLMDPVNVQAAIARRSLTTGPTSCAEGRFVNLHCGHNNAFSQSEQDGYRHVLRTVLQE